MIHSLASFVGNREATTILYLVNQAGKDGLDPAEAEKIDPSGHALTKLLVASLVRHDEKLFIAVAGRCLIEAILEISVLQSDLDQARRYFGYYQKEAALGAAHDGADEIEANISSLKLEEAQRLGYFAYDEKKPRGEPEASEN